jgi:pyridoxine 5-phosphate synthase
MILLGVNIDHCATVRQARYRGYTTTVGGAVEPDPVLLATLAERAGADGITIHLREDRRHIQERDVWRLREVAQTRINLEMACTPAMVEFALQVRPASVCLVPESREEISTEGGLEVAGQLERVRAVCATMRDAGIIVSLFIDPEMAQIDAAAAVEAPWIELHTGAWANCFYSPKRAEEFARLVAAARHAHAARLRVNAGHGINYVNVAEIRTLPYVHELNIGHSIISRALSTGIEEAVREMRARMNPSHGVLPRPSP